MFAYFTANMDFKTSVQLQRSKTFLKLSKHMALHVVRASGELQTKGEQRNTYVKVNRFYLILLRIMVF